MLHKRNEAQHKTGEDQDVNFDKVLQHKSGEDQDLNFDNVLQQ